MSQPGRTAGGSQRGDSLGSCSVTRLSYEVVPQVGPLSGTSAGVLGSVPARTLPFLLPGVGAVAAEVSPLPGKGRALRVGVTGTGPGSTSSGGAVAPKNPSHELTPELV